MSVKRIYLYFMAALIWGVPGVLVTLKGIRAYGCLPLGEQWWPLAVTLCVLVAFYFMFRRIVARYSARIAALPAVAPIWQTFSLRGWILLIFMMGLGLVLKSIPSLPIQFTASFYTGLGPMLIWSSIMFLRNSRQK